MLQEKAPDGLLMGESMPADITVEGHNTKRLPGQFGIDDFIDDIIENTDENMDWEPISIIHKTKNGGNVKMDIKIGRGHSPAAKKALHRLFQNYSEIFYDDPSFFPYLLDSQGKPIIHKLSLRSDAVVRNTPSIIKLPPEKSRALSELVSKKLKAGIFKELDRSESAYCSPISIVPKSGLNPDGSKRWRLIQSLINVSENSMHVNFKLESAEELIEKLPPGANVFSFFDRKSVIT